MNRADMRFELAKAAMMGLCANSEMTSSSSASIADLAIDQADKLMDLLNITPETRSRPMNLRDYFAGQALAGILSIHEAWDNVGESEISFQAWSQADQMLKDRIEEPAQLPTRGEIAVAAMSAMLAVGDGTPPGVIAIEAVRCADALLAELTKEQQPDAQQMEAMRYTTAMHMLREISPDSILALVPNTGMGIGEFWDVVRIDHEGECKPYDGVKSTEPIWLMGRDKDPLNAVAQAQQSLEKEAST